LSSTTFGLALACKISSIFILPLNILFLLFAFIPQYSHISIKKIFHLRIIHVFIIFFLYGFYAYITTRIANPYLFESSNIFNPFINHLYIQNWKILNAEYSPGTSFPPAIQFLHSIPILFSLKNLVFFGVGLPQFLLLLTGIYFCFKKIKSPFIFLTIFWIIGVFIYQSSLFPKFMRYFNVLYPFLAVFSAIGFYYIFKKIHLIYSFITLIILLILPLSFLSIYSNKHTRIAASEWIYENLPTKSIILDELWDDPLPLQVTQNYGKQYTIEMMPVFDADTSEKWTKMNNLLQKGDYLILSSNRAWASIPTVPERYPTTTKYYHDLFAGRLPYKKIKKFTSYPSLRYLGIPLTFPDYWADENFTVFDHPQVIIFQKMSL